MASVSGGGSPMHAPLPPYWTIAEKQEQLVKEALHTQMIPTEERFNQDGGLEVPGCCTVMRSPGGRSNPHRPLTSNDVYPQ